MTKLPDYLIKSVALAALSGSRSFLGMSLVSFMLSRNPSRKLQRSHLPFKYLQLPAVTNTLAVLTVAEMAGDKLPFTPNRTDALPLAGRFVFGAVTTATLLKARGGNAVTGMILGGACALTAAFASFYLRKAITGPKVNNIVAGLIEDVILLGIGMTIISRIGSKEIK